MGVKDGNGKLGVFPCHGQGGNQVKPPLLLSDLVSLYFCVNLGFQPIFEIFSQKLSPYFNFFLSIPSDLNTLQSWRVSGHFFALLEKIVSQIF